MPSTTREFSIGGEVSSSNGVCGEIRRVVVDPVDAVLTHLVVEPRNSGGHGRLVPVDLVEPEIRAITLRCSTDEFNGLERAEVSRFVPGARGPWSFGQDQMLSWPYYCLVPEGERMGGASATIMGTGLSIAAVDQVPEGMIEIRRGERVHATDGDIGRVKGLVVDPRDHSVTHVLLDQGHFWGEQRVAIPIAAVTSIDDGIRLAIDKTQVRNLPSVAVEQPSLAS
jgi:sporulation protein YlmC with PRC-barrel domain